MVDSVPPELALAYLYKFVPRETLGLACASTSYRRRYHAVVEAYRRRMQHEMYALRGHVSTLVMRAETLALFLKQPRAPSIGANYIRIKAELRERCEAEKINWDKVEWFLATL